MCLVGYLKGPNFLSVPWDVCTMPKDECGLGLNDIATRGSILATKWVVRDLEGSSPW